MVFVVFDFLQKMNEGIRLYCYDTSNRLVFVRFLEEIEDTKKPFRNNLTFSAFFGEVLVSLGSFLGYDPCLFGRAEILVIFGWHFRRNDDLINSF